MKSAFLHEKQTLGHLAEFISTAPRLSMDRKCRDFEKKFSEFQKTNDSILFNSGGSANLAILQTLKNLGRLKDGDRVGFSALTWSTNVMPIIQLGMIPVPIDCNQTTLNVMSDNLKKTLEATQIKAFFITNVLGFCGDLINIQSLCHENNILLIEDNCEALGTEVYDGKTGTFGAMSSFSFFVAHHMSSIEGGMVCTHDEEMGEMLRIVRANGWDRNLSAIQQHKWRNQYGIKSEFEAKYTFYDLGYNLRPTEITGFLGLYQMDFLEETITSRESNFQRMDAIAKNNEELISLKTDHIKRLSNFSFPVVCKTPKLREKYLRQFSGAGIEIRPLIAGNMTKQPFYSKYCKESVNLPNTDFLHNNSFYFGNYPELSESDLETIFSCLISY
jgi:CDP-4-dehydro-6-deoxyglucose reductase, E1